MINNDPTTIRALAALTDTYVAATVVECIDASSMYVYVTYTKGTETSAELKFEYSPDGTIWGQETAISIYSGTSTDRLLEHSISATGVYVYQIPVMGFKFRVSAKGTGTVSGTMKIDLQEGND